MIRINLLPYRAARQIESGKKSLMIFVLVLVIFALALGFAYKHLNNNIGKLNSQVAHTKKEIDKYNKINAEITTLRDQLTLLQRKLDVIASLQNDRLTTVTLLDNLTQSVVPQSMWLTQLNTAGNNAVTLGGLATDNKVVADFMLNLETGPRYTQVALKSVKQTTISSRPLKEFSLSFNLKTAPPLEQSTATAATGGR